MSARPKADVVAFVAGKLKPLKLTEERATKLVADLGDESGTRRALERGLALKGDDAELREKLRSTYEKLKAYPELAAHITEDARRTTETPDKVRLLRAAADIHTKQLSDASAAATLLAEARAQDGEQLADVGERADRGAARRLRFVLRQGDRGR